MIESRCPRNAFEAVLCPFTTESLGLEKIDGRSFNCAESVLIRVNRDSSLPGFNDSCMRIASVLGGGFAGCGEVCGAASGAVLCLALLTGTTGVEPVEDFKEKRKFARSVISEFMNEFSDSWGSVQCKFLIAMDKGGIPAKGKLRSGPPRNLCNTYTDWCTARVLEIKTNLDL
jgi:C_GCAxxG_C_C family probable redox protein